MTAFFDFDLPKGYLDAEGNLHKRGKMRLATAGDEISAARDPRVLANPSYMPLVIFSKVIVELEGVDAISSSVLEQLYSSDLAFLQDMYQKINDIEAPCINATCPKCGATFKTPAVFTAQ